MEEEKLVEFCPHCKSKEEFIPIAYGLPSKELMDMADKGEVILGGCVITEPIRYHQCRRCGKRY